MEKVYLLNHVYEQDEIEEVKFIGVFSSMEKALKVIEELKDLPGYNKHPIECFHLEDWTIDEYTWKEGFISWEEAKNDDKE
ncbi:MAG TPA: hypothetical protein VK559_02305 [Ferruginibacter sp.]|nr:hypothetical protein [Ferruginibacter sp.]